MLNIGLTAEQGAADDPVYVAAGLEDGVYWFDDNGEFVRNSNLHSEGGTVDAGQMSGSRMIGLYDIYYENMHSRPEAKQADALWHQHWGDEGALPTSLTMSMSVKDSETYASNNVMILDHVNSMVPKFIMGTVPLNEDSWDEYVNQLKAYGIEENIELQQKAYDAYLAR